MNKFWQIVKHEYTRHVLNKRFIWTVLGLPLAIIFLIAVVFIVGLFVVDRSPIGYVDQAGVLELDQLPTSKGTFFEPVMQMIAFDSPEEASISLEKNQIQAYFVIPPGFDANRAAKVFYKGKMGFEAQNQIDNILRLYVLSGQSIPNSERVLQGSDFQLQEVEGGEEIQSSDWANILIPLVIGLIFIFVVMISGGYLLQAVVEEKENRTMEIMVTSVSPVQLMAGKIIGNLLVGLTQLLIWILFIWLGLFITGRYIPLIANLQISSQTILISLLLMLPAFVFVAALMATLGATVTEAREAQQVSGLFTLPIMFPFYFISSIMTSPNGPIARVLSYFPMSAPMAIMMRMAFSKVPTWEIVMVILILITFSAFTIWLAGRAFRVGMLSYGKRISLRQLFKKEVNHV